MLSSLTRSIGRPNTLGFFSFSSNVAVVFSGCGVYDGSEITESVAALVHLSAAQANVACFAPDIPQMHVVDHLKMEPSEGETRNVLVESARICRGNIQSLDSLKADEFDALFLPGGFGAAKNLSSFATSGPDMDVNGELGSLIRAFHQQGKVIGMVCISPVIASKVLPGVKITLGSDGNEEEWPHREAIDAAKQMGADVKICDIDEVCSDEQHKIVTGPAYMKNASPHEVFENVGKVIREMLRMA